MPHLTVYACPSCGEPWSGRAGQSPVCWSCRAEQRMAGRSPSAELRESLAEQAREAARHTTC